MGRLIRSVDDLTDEEIRWVLDRGLAHRSGSAARLVPPPLVGLCFLETSLRTRVGFSAAAARLGGQALGVAVQRASEISMPESVHDTLRTLLGYTDVVVARPGVPLDDTHVPRGTSTPLLSGGDRGPHAEHPSQALIDLFAIERERGGLAGVRLAVVGDPRMRSVASLLRLAVRFPPQELTIVTTDRLRVGLEVPEQLAGVLRWGSPEALAAADVVYVAGIPHGATTEPERTHLRVTAATLAALGRDAVVMSPLPVIDEIERQAWRDPRVRAFQHSDDGLFVRMALLELALGVR